MTTSLLMLTRLLRSINTGSRSLGPTENTIFDIIMTTLWLWLWLWHNGTNWKCDLWQYFDYDDSDDSGGGGGNRNDDGDHKRIVCKILEDDDDNYENVKMTIMTVMTRPLIRICFCNDDGHPEPLEDDRWKWWQRQQCRQFSISHNFSNQFLIKY